jgi:hypothetical protein
MTRYVRRHPRLRGGWDVGADEFKSLGFTVGLPPNVYVPQTAPIAELSHRFESCDSSLLDIESDFSVQDRQFLFQDARSVRCFVRDLPPDMDSDQLKRAINQKMVQRRLTTSAECVEKVTINPCGQFAFVDFPRARDAERFIELKDSLEIEGQTIKIRRSFKTSPEAADTEVRPERGAALVVCGLAGEADVRAAVGEFAKVAQVEIAGTGDAIVDLEDAALVDIVVLQLRVRGVECARCFPRAATRANVDRAQFVGESGKLVTVAPGMWTVADVLNLDVQISTVVRNWEDVRVEGYNKLRIFNVTRGSGAAEIGVAVDDVRKELERYTSLEKVYADVLGDDAAVLGVPIVAEFGETREAAMAQRDIAGRRYRGRVVITMLE